MGINLNELESILSPEPTEKDQLTGNNPTDFYPTPPAPVGLWDRFQGLNEEGKGKYLAVPAVIGAGALAHYWQRNKLRDTALSELWSARNAEQAQLALLNINGYNGASPATLTQEGIRGFYSLPNGKTDLSKFTPEEMKAYANQIANSRTTLGRIASGGSGIPSIATNAVVTVPASTLPVYTEAGAGEQSLGLTGLTQKFLTPQRNVDVRASAIPKLLAEGTISHNVPNTPSLLDIRMAQKEGIANPPVPLSTARKGINLAKTVDKNLSGKWGQVGAGAVELATNVPNLPNVYDYILQQERKNLDPEKDYVSYNYGAPITAGFNSVVSAGKSLLNARTAFKSGIGESITYEPIMKGVRENKLKAIEFKKKLLSDSESSNEKALNYNLSKNPSMLKELGLLDETGTKINPNWKEIVKNKQFKKLTIPEQVGNVWYDNPNY
jgi:hypothetical protein